MPNNSYPSQSQLTFPLLEVLYDLGPSAPMDVYDAVAAIVQVPEDALGALTAGGVRAWDRHVRWAEQRTQQRALTRHPRRNRWELAERGVHTLEMAEPGILHVAFKNPLGEVLWADSLTVLRGLPPSSVDLFFTSPPYYLQKVKKYGGPTSEQEYLNWFLPFAREMHAALKDSGSLVLNIAPGPYLKGVPVRSPIVHRLVLALMDQIGFYLAGEHIWHNPAALPRPAEWVNVRRLRAKDTYEMVLWFSKTPWPNADNRRVLVAYSESQKKLIEKGWTAQRRPSGHELTGNMAKNHGGAIPGTVLTVPNTVSHDAYMRYCKEHNLDVHPARFPAQLPEWWIQFVTDPGQLVVDPFAGSLTTAAVADRMGRRWMAIERSKVYIDGGIGGRLAGA